MDTLNQITTLMEQYKDGGGDLTALSAACQELCATGKTPLGLNKWELYHKPSMAQFNEDNRIVDEKLREILAALDKKVNVGAAQEYDLQLAAGYSGWGKYGKNQFGRVHICMGTITPTSGSAANGSVFATLPTGYYNSHRSVSVPIIIYSNKGASGYLIIERNGQLRLDCGNGAGTIMSWGGETSFQLSAQ